MIQRGRRVITAPTRNETLMPYDRIFVVGNDQDLQRFENYLINEMHAEEEGLNFKLSSYFVTDKSQYIGKTIRDSGLREATIGLVVGIERDGKRILNPDSTLTIQTSDLLWIVGDAEKIRLLT
jgi:CPA2 family monovalent cation:H+ antiporter-2